MISQAQSLFIARCGAGGGESRGRRDDGESRRDYRQGESL